jgi:BirA family biotin operon repressor/biotin-[acetyl-CoA-carboxylase] ligase
LWFSVLLRPAWGREFLERVTPLVAVAVAGGIAEATNLPARIKPPNDVFVDGRKVAGILTEARTGRETFAVVGIGVNVSHAVEDFPLELQTTATSLALAVGGPVERERVLVAILRELDRWYAAGEAPGEELADAYAALSRRPVCDSFLP